MAGVFDDDIAMAKELIAEFGQVCQWRKEVTTPANPNRPWQGGSIVPTVKTPSICFLPASDGGDFGSIKFTKGDDVPTFSTVGLMAAQDFKPEVTDLVLRDGRALVLVAIDTLNPNGQDVLHILSIV